MAAGLDILAAAAAAASASKEPPAGLEPSQSQQLVTDSGPEHLKPGSEDALSTAAALHRQQGVLLALDHAAKCQGGCTLPVSWA